MDIFDGDERRVRRWKWPISIGICFVSIAVLAFAAYGVYQSHLSSDLKRVLTAALDPTASMADVRVYQRDARLAVRTQKDREVDAKFEKLFALAEENCDEEESSMKSDQEASHESLRAVHTYQDTGTAAPKSTMQEMDAAVDAARKSFDGYLACEEKINKNREGSSGLVADLRTALSLPPSKADSAPTQPQK
jgi:hypothetical protein